MKVKIGQVMNARPVFEKMVKFELSFPTIRAISKLIKAAASELELVEQKRVELVKKYGITDDKGNLQVTPENMESFIKEFNEIANTEIDFEAVVSEKQLDHANVVLSTQEYYLIEPFFTE